MAHDLPKREDRFTGVIDPVSRRFMIYDKDTLQYLGDLICSDKTLDELCYSPMSTIVRLGDWPEDFNSGAVIHMFKTGDTLNAVEGTKLEDEIKKDLE